ncbi:hypothetical protein JYU34_002287 [Plutella xylostella]|uniref:Uncharacterized protein n=1 Tax=Plutella xylostella TaxID=51655 RepID=A0ABQ7R1S3_PLUXY|nr:hypothetical protein JYU34_002287 [Plutella xylostella]
MHILEIGGEQDEEGARAVDAAFRTVPRDHTAFLVWKITVSTSLPTRYLNLPTQRHYRVNCCGIH